MGLLSHQTATSTLPAFSVISNLVPSGWMARQARQALLVDCHRVYRWLASGAIGWSGEQLTALDVVLGRVREMRGMESRIAELWNADEDRIDSLGTELLLADYLGGAGFSFIPDVPVGGRLPEFLVEGEVLVEAKTQCPPRADSPLARFKFEVTHNVDVPRVLWLHGITGTMMQNHVGPLVRQIRKRVSRGGLDCVTETFAHAGVSVTVEFSEEVEGWQGGCCLSTNGFIPDEEAGEDLFEWMEDRASLASQQMRDPKRKKMVVLDISWNRQAMDLVPFRPNIILDAHARLAHRHPSLDCVLARREGNLQFGRLTFLTTDPAVIIRGHVGAGGRRIAADS